MPRFQPGAQSARTGRRASASDAPAPATSGPRVQVVGPSLQRERDVEAVLRSLPQWFGIEHALVAYAADSATLPTFAAEVDGKLVGFLSLKQHFPASWEVHGMAVMAGLRNQGLGSLLLQHAERHVIQQGGRYLQVKTVAETRAGAPYTETRTFYQAQGFTPLEIFPTLWDANNPALQLVKALKAV